MLRPGLVLIYALCLPLALVAGYLLANPTTFTSFSFLSLVFCVLLFPLFIRGHHTLLIFAWNSFLIVFFLPGEPSLGVFLAVGSLFMSILNHTLRKSEKFITPASVALPLVLLLVVVFVTIMLTGGVGARSLGSESFGAKRYITLIGAIIGFFALTAKSIPKNKRILMASVYFLSGLTAAVSDIAYALGPAFYFLFIVFSSSLAAMQVVTQDTLLRFSGVTWASLALCFYLLMRFGIAGLFQVHRPWRLGLFVVGIVASLFGGFRSSIIILAILLLTQFYYEGLFRTKFFPIFVMAVMVSALVVLPFVDKLPLSVQRSLSFLPINVDRVAAYDAISTLDWRLEMWKIMVPEIPKYILIGKGYTFSGTDYFLTQEATRRGLYRAYESTLITGNYHSGLLTIIIPFGIFGLIAFFWFCWAALRVLYKNYQNGSDDLKTVNTFLLSFFVGRLIFYLFFYGQLELDLHIFTGAVGMSVALNGGVLREKAPEEVVLKEEPEAVAA